MKILQIVPELNQGGVERGTVELNRELILRGHESIVISAGGLLAQQISLDGGTHISLDVCSKNLATALPRILKLRKLVENLKPDIVHPRSRVPAWMSFFALKGKSIPLVTTVHGFNSVHAYSKIMLVGKRVIYGSTSIKDYVEKNYTFDKTKLRYVPRGIDMKYFSPEMVEKDFVRDFIKKNKIEDRYLITIVGRITEWKGHEDFIRAIGALHKKNPKICGLIVGRTADNKSDYQEKIMNLARDNGGDAAFCFVGPQTQVREIYSLSNMIVSAASTKPETFGRIAAEALAMDTPVVASNHGGSLDIIRDGEVGLLFTAGDYKDLARKIEKAMTHKFGNLREHIQQNFSLDYMVDTELEVYKEVVGKG